MKMKLKNINSIHGWHHLLSIVNCQLFVVIALFAFPLSMSAQDDEEAEAQVNTVVTLKQKQAVVIDPLILEAMPQDLRIPTVEAAEIAEEENGREAA